ncbi:ADP-ribosylglycohydrolase family protein [Streptomyces cavernae]|uniref:ADP-ribosylglycohydrolase family protein n=1 Tax=Streptomyces cavernae TaxID=2259034 RepID=UPI00192E735A|nr:ADP-ribosylglycohydrolase family protein [Streptomyces cavernae]
MRPPPHPATHPLRLTWVQPEDLVGHELRQAREDGRDPAEIAARWRAAGGREAPLSAGASSPPAPARLRVLAEALLDELALLPNGSAAREPTDLAEIRALCPDWRDTIRPGTDRSGDEHGTGKPGTHRPGDQHSTDRPGSTATSTIETGAIQTGWTATNTTATGATATSTTTTTGRTATDTTTTGRASVARLEAAWLGRAAGCLLGKPVEKLPLHGIRAIARATGNWPLHTWFTGRGLPAAIAAAHPWNRRSATTSLAENIDGMPEDDDLNYPLLNLLLLQRHGKRFSTGDVAALWLAELPAARTFTAERIAYRNLLTGLEPPHTATHHNPFREWVGALIRADVHGWTNPGDPAAAAEQAHRDATLTHTANGVYGAMFVAATIAEAATGSHDVHHCLRTGLTVVPPGSRLHRAVDDAVRLALAERDFEKVVDRLHTAHDAYHWVHVIPNAALVAAALTHADGDFEASVCRAVSGGWDTDSNGATAGSVAGLLSGSPLPARWTAPLKNRLATSVAGFDGTGFDTLAELTFGLTHRESPHS